MGNNRGLGIRNITKFNTALSASILHHYYKLQEENPSKLTKGGHEFNGANQVRFLSQKQLKNKAFYDWQIQSGGWNALSQQEEFQKLLEIFQTTTDIFLRNMGIDEVKYFFLIFNFFFKETIKERKRGIQAWATVHESKEKKRYL